MDLPAGADDLELEGEDLFLDFLAADPTDAEEGTLTPTGEAQRGLQDWSAATLRGKPVNLRDISTERDAVIISGILSRVPIEEVDAEAPGDEWDGREILVDGEPKRVSFTIAEWSIEYGADGATDVYVHSASTSIAYLLRRDGLEQDESRVIELLGRVVHVVTEEPTLSWSAMLDELANPAEEGRNAYTEEQVLESRAFLLQQLDNLAESDKEGGGAFLLCPVYAHLCSLSSEDHAQLRKKRAVVAKPKGGKRSSKRTGVTSSLTHTEYRTQRVVEPSPVVARVWGEFWQKSVKMSESASKPDKISLPCRELSLKSPDCRLGRAQVQKNHYFDLFGSTGDEYPTLSVGECVEVKGAEIDSKTTFGVVRDIYQKGDRVLFHYQVLIPAKQSVLCEQGQDGDLFATSRCEDSPIEDIQRVIGVALSPAEIGTDVVGDLPAHSYVLRGWFRERSKKDDPLPYIGLGLTRLSDDFLSLADSCPACAHRDEVAAFLEPRVIKLGDGSLELHYRGQVYCVGDCVYIGASVRKTDPLAFDDKTRKSKNFTPAQLFGSRELAPNDSGYFRPEMWEERDARVRVVKDGIVFKDDAADAAEPDENADAEGIKAAPTSKSSGRRYVRPGQKEDGDAGDLTEYPAGTVRCPGFGDENWRDRLAMKRYKEAHAHLKERREHVPHHIGRIVGISDRSVELAMFARRSESQSFMALSNTEREVFYRPVKKSWAHEKIVGRCVVEPRTAAVSQDDLLDWVQVPHRFFAFRELDRESTMLSVGVPQVHRRVRAAVPPLVAGAEANGLRVLDLFAGAGGLSSGFDAAGFTTTWAVERDPAACETLRHNHPHCTVFDKDINLVLERIRAGDVSYPQRGQVDVVVGGPPCQGFSGLNRHVERRKGEDPMNAMMVTYLSIIEELRPSYFCMENVKGLLSAADKKIASLILNTLVQLNYQIRFALLQAGHYGVPQDRKRVILIGTRPGYQVPDYPQPTHCFQSVGSTYRTAFMTFPSTGASLPMVTVRDAISDLPVIHPTIEAEREMPPLDYASPPRSDYARLLRGRQQRLISHVAKAQSHVNQLRFENVPVGRPGADWRDLPDQLIPFCLPNTSDRHNDWAGLYGRLAWDWRWQCLLTSPNPFRSIVVHPVENRLISVRECARAMGYPDRFEFQGDLKGQYRQNGNAVPVPLARAIGLEVAKAAGRSGVYQSMRNNGRGPLVDVVVGDPASMPAVIIADATASAIDEDGGKRLAPSKPTLRRMRPDDGEGDDDVDDDDDDDELELEAMDLGSDNESDGAAAPIDDHGEDEPPVAKRPKSKASSSQRNSSPTTSPERWKTEILVELPLAPTVGPPVLFEIEIPLAPAKKVAIEAPKRSGFFSRGVRK